MKGYETGLVAIENAVGILRLRARGVVPADMPAALVQATDGQLLAFIASKACELAGYTEGAAS